MSKYEIGTAVGKPSPLSDVTCVRESCSKPITQLALDSGDPYCSRDCAYPKPPRQCPICTGTVPETATSARVYCSEACSKIAANRHKKTPRPVVPDDDGLPDDIGEAELSDLMGAA